MQNIALFGGSFDPVHLGHLLVAQAAREELNLSRLFLIPAARSPFKPDRAPTPGDARVQLLRLALAGKDWCEIDEQELKRGGVSYTIDTVRDYARRFPGAQLFYLIGADHVEQLPKWREAAELARLTEFVVIPRPGAESTGLEQHTELQRLETLDRPTEPATASATTQRSPIGSPPVPPSIAPFRIRRLNGFPLGVSSSQIRARIAAGKTIEPLVPGPVAEAIANNRLYL